MRRQLAVILSDLTLERASQRKNAAFLLVYLFRAFSGVTLPEEKRYAIGKHHLCTREHTVANDAGWPEEIGELRLEAKHTIDMARFVDLDKNRQPLISRSPITFFPMVTALMKAMSFCVMRASARSGHAG